jgi:hypothetical protein
MFFSILPMAVRRAYHSPVLIRTGTRQSGC